MNRKLHNHSTKQFQSRINDDNEKLLTRLLNTKPSLHDFLTHPPKRFSHLDSNLKRRELEEGIFLYLFIPIIVKITEIERENRILLEK
jgi:hypothetical protein